MTNYFKSPQHNDREDCHRPLRLRNSPDAVNPTHELQFVGNTQVSNDIQQLIRILQKYPQIRDAVATALRRDPFPE